MAEPGLEVGKTRPVASQQLAPKKTEKPNVPKGEGIPAGSAPIDVSTIKQVGVEQNLSREAQVQYDVIKRFIDTKNIIENKTTIKREAGDFFPKLSELPVAQQILLLDLLLKDLDDKGTETIASSFVLNLAIRRLAIETDGNSDLNVIKNCLKYFNPKDPVFGKMRLDLTQMNEGMTMWLFSILNSLDNDNVDNDIIAVSSNLKEYFTNEPVVGNPNSNMLDRDTFANNKRFLEISAGYFDLLTQKLVLLKQKLDGKAIDINSIMKNVKLQNNLTVGRGTGYIDNRQELFGGPIEIYSYGSHVANNKGDGFAGSPGEVSFVRDEKTGLFTFKMKYLDNKKVKSEGQISERDFLAYTRKHNYGDTFPAQFYFNPEVFGHLIVKKDQLVAEQKLVVEIALNLLIKAVNSENFTEVEKFIEDNAKKLEPHVAEYLKLNVLYEKYSKTDDKKLFDSVRESIKTVDAEAAKSWIGNEDEGLYFSLFTLKAKIAYAIGEKEAFGKYKEVFSGIKLKNYQVEEFRFLQLETKLNDFLDTKKTELLDEMKPLLPLDKVEEDISKISTRMLFFLLSYAQGKQDSEQTAKVILELLCDSRKESLKAQQINQRDEAIMNLFAKLHSDKVEVVGDKVKALLEKKEVVAAKDEKIYISIGKKAMEYADTILNNYKIVPDKNDKAPTSAQLQQVMNAGRIKAVIADDLKFTEKVKDTATGVESEKSTGMVMDEAIRKGISAFQILQNGNLKVDDIELAIGLFASKGYIEYSKISDSEGVAQVESILAAVKNFELAYRLIDDKANYKYINSKFEKVKIEATVHLILNNLNKIKNESPTELESILNQLLKTDDLLKGLHSIIGTGHVDGLNEILNNTSKTNSDKLLLLLKDITDDGHVKKNIDAIDERIKLISEGNKPATKNIADKEKAINVLKDLKMEIYVKSSARKILEAPADAKVKELVEEMKAKIDKIRTEAEAANTEAKVAQSDYYVWALVDIASALSKKIEAVKQNISNELKDSATVLYDELKKVVLNKYGITQDGSKKIIVDSTTFNKLKAKDKEAFATAIYMIGLLEPHAKVTTSESKVPDVKKLIKLIKDNKVTVALNPKLKAAMYLFVVNDLLKGIEENKQKGAAVSDDLYTELDGYTSDSDLLSKCGNELSFYLSFANLRKDYFKTGSLTLEQINKVDALAKDDKAKSLLNTFSANYHLDQVVDEKDEVNLSAARKALDAVTFKNDSEYMLSDIRYLLKRNSDAEAEGIINTIKYENLTEPQKFSYNLTKFELFNLFAKKDPNNTSGKSILPKGLVATLEKQAKTPKDQITVKVLQAVNLLNRQKNKEDAEYANFNKFLTDAEGLLTSVADTKVKAKEQNNIDLLRGLGHFQRQEYTAAKNIFAPLIGRMANVAERDNPVADIAKLTKERTEYLRTLGVYIATYLKANKNGKVLDLADIKLDTLLPLTFIGRDTDLNDIKRSYALDLMFAKREYTELIDKSFEGQVPPAGDVVKQKLELIKGFANLYEVSGNPKIEAAKGISNKVAGDSVITDIDNKILLISLEQEIKYAEKSASASDNLGKKIDDNFSMYELQDHQKTQLVETYRKFLQKTGQATANFDALIGSKKILEKEVPFIYKLATEADRSGIDMKSKAVNMEDFKKNFPAQAANRLEEVGKLDSSITDNTIASDVSENVSSLRQVQRFDKALTLITEELTVITEALKKVTEPNNQKVLLNEKKAFLKMLIETKLDIMQLKKPNDRGEDANSIAELIGKYKEISNVNGVQDPEVQVEATLLTMALATAEGKSIFGSDGKILSEFSITNFPQRNQNVFKFRKEMMVAYNKMAQKGFSDYSGVKNDVDEAFKAMPIVDQFDYKEAKMGIYVRMVDSAKGNYELAGLVDPNVDPKSKDAVIPMSWDQAATLLAATKPEEALTLLGRLANTPDDSLFRIKATLAGYDSFSYVEGNETYPQYFESLGATPTDKSKSMYGFLQTPYGLRWIDSRKSSVADSSSTVPVDVVVDRIGNSSRTLGPLKIETSSNTQLQDFTTASQSMSLNNTNVQLIKGVNAIEETVIKHGEAWIKVPRPPVEGEYPDQQYFDDVKIPISWPEQVLVPHDFGNKKLDPNYKYLLDTQEVKATLPLTKDMSLFGAYSEQKDISANNSVLGPTSFKKEDSGNLFDVRKVEAGVSLRGSGTDEISFSGTHYFSDQQVGSVVADGAIVNKPPVENEFKANFSKQLPGNFTFMGYYQMDNRGQTHGELGLQYQDKTTGKIYIYFTQGKYDYLTSDGYGNVEAKTFGARWEKTYQAATGELTLFLETQLRSDNNAKKINDGPLVRLGVENTNNLGDGGSFRQEVAATIQKPGEGPLSSVGAAMIYRNNLKGFLSSSLLGKEVRVDLLAEDNKKLEDLLGLGGKRAKIDSFNASKYKGAFQIENGSLICKDRKSFDELIDELGKMREYQLASVLLETKLRSNIDTLISKNSSFDGVSNNELLEYKKLLDSFENKSNIFVKRDKEELKLGFLRSIDPLANTLLAKISYQVSVQYILAEIFVRDHGGTADKIDFKPEQIQQLMANVKIAVDDLNILGFETRIKIGSSLVNILSHPEALLNIGVECIKDFRVNEDTKFRLGGELSTFDPHLHAEFLMEFNNKYTVSLGNQMGVEVIDDTGAKVQAGVKIDLLGLFGYGRSVIAITFNNKKASNLHGGVVDYFSFGRTGFFIRQEKNPGQQFEFASGEVLSAYQYFGKTNYKILVASVGSEHFKYLEAWVKDVCSIKGTGDKQIKIMYDEEDAIKLYHIERFQELELFKTLVTELYKRKDKGIEGFKILNAVFLNRNENKFDGDTLSVDMDTLKSMVREINKNSSGRTAEVIINEYLNKFLGNNHTQRVSVHNQLIQDVVGEGLFVSGLSMSKLEKSPNYKYSKGKLSITGALTKHEFDMLKNIGCSVDDRKQIDKLLLKYEVKENITYLADKGLEFKFSDNKLISRIANDDLALLGLNKTLSVLRNELDANIQEMVFNIDDSGVCGFFRSKELKRYTLNIALENLKSIGKDKADISENDIINTIRGEVSRINYVDKNLSSLMAMLNKERIDVDFYHNIQRSKDTGNAVFSIKMRGASKYNKQTWDYEVIKNNSGEIALFEIKDGERKQIQIDSQSNVFHRALFLMFKGGGKVPSAYVQIFNNAKLNASENAKEQALLGSTPVVDQVALKEATEVLQFKQIVLEAKRKDLKTANSNIQNLSERLATAESNLVKLRAEVARLEQEIADLNVELGPKKEEASSKQKALDLLKAEVIVLEAAVKALPEIVQNATKALEAERQNESALKSKIDENEKKLAELNKQSEGLDRFTQGKSKYEAELVSTKKQLAEEEGKWFFKSKGLIESLKNAKQVQENVIKAYTNKIAEATKAKADSLPIAQEQSKLVAQHKLSGESITVLAAEEQRVILELETKNRDLVAKNAIVASLTAEIAALNLQVSDLGKQIEGKQSLAASVQNSVEDNEAIKVSVESELAKAKAELPAREAAVKKAEQELARAKQAVNRAGQPTQNTQQLSNTPALPAHAVERPLAKSVPSTVVESKSSNVAAKSAITSIRTQLGGISTPSVFNRSLDLASDRPWTDLDKLEDVTDIEFIQSVVYLTRNNANQPEANKVNAEAIKQGTFNWNVNFSKLMKHYNVSDKRELVYIAVAKKMKDMKVTENKEELKKELDKISDREVRKKLVDILVHKFKVNVDIPKVEPATKSSRITPGPGFKR